MLPCFWVTCTAVLPLGGEDSVEDGALPAVSCGLQDKHVLDDVEGETIVREGTQELGFQEGGPLLLQHPLTPFVTLPTVEIRFCD